MTVCRLLFVVAVAVAAWAAWAMVTADPAGPTTAVRTTTVAPS